MKGSFFTWETVNRRQTSLILRLAAKTRFLHKPQPFPSLLRKFPSLSRETKMAFRSSLFRLRSHLLRTTTTTTTSTSRMFLSNSPILCTIKSERLLLSPHSDLREISTEIPLTHGSPILLHRPTPPYPLEERRHRGPSPSTPSPPPLDLCFDVQLHCGFYSYRIK